MLMNLTISRSRSVSKSISPFHCKSMMIPYDEMFPIAVIGFRHRVAHKAHEENQRIV